MFIRITCKEISKFCSCMEKAKGNLYEIDNTVIEAEELLHPLAGGRAVEPEVNLN